MIYIVVRRTTDWSDEAVVRAQLPVGFARAVDLWNATFEMPYHVFRQQLKVIAQLSWSHVRGAMCAACREVPNGGIIVPTDDDDWFAPHLAELLEPALDHACIGYSWTSKFIEVPTTLRHEIGVIRRRIFPNTPLKMVCTTNNYAVVMCPESAELIDNHLRATRWFIENRHRVKRLTEPLSVMNRTLASHTSLWPPPSRRKLVRKYRRYQRLYRKPLAPQLSWAVPYYEMLRGLMETLRLRS